MVIIMGTILLFNVNKGKRKKIELVAWKLNHEAKLVDRKDYSKPLGNLIGITVGQNTGNIVKSDRANLVMDKEMMVISGLDSDAVDDFLTVYNDAGIDSIQMKAIVTESNIFWTAEKLYEELEEHSRV